jgi:hypothetical protein
MVNILFSNAKYLKKCKIFNLKQPQFHMVDFDRIINIKNVYFLYFYNCYWYLSKRERYKKREKGRERYVEKKYNRKIENCKKRS